MIDPDDENALRLGMFAATMLVYAHRGSIPVGYFVRTGQPAGVDPNAPPLRYDRFGNQIYADSVFVIDQDLVAEARAITEAIVEEAKRLNAQRKPD